MTTKQPGRDKNGRSGDGHTIDLQGVAAFAGLVELLAQELGTSPGRMQGLLPTGPNTFEELAGEIELNSQGYARKLTLFSQPGDKLKMHFESGLSQARQADPDMAFAGAVEATFSFNGTVEEIVPQGRALARYVEDVFKVMDSMVTLGKSGKLSGMSVATSDIESFERANEDNLVQEADSGKQATFDP